MDFRRTITDMICAEALKSKDDIRRMLGSVENVSITLDLWSDRTMRGFLGVTAHFVWNDLLKTKTLAAKRITGNKLLII